MTFTQLRCFYEISETGNFTKAAEQMYMSQSSMSKYIGQLEAELGFPLFNRLGKSVELTNEGVRLLPLCARVLTAVKDLRITAGQLRRTDLSENSSLYISGIPTMSAFGGFQLIKAFLEVHPDFDIRFTEAEEKDIHSHLQSGQCDIAFCSNLRISPDYYQMLPVETEYFSAVTSKNNWMFPSEDEVRIRDLKDVPLILNLPGSQIFDYCRDACLGQGFEPTIQSLCNQPHSIHEYLSLNPCCYVGFRRIIEAMETNDLHNAPVVDLPPLDFIFCWKKDSLSPAAQKFVLFLRNYLSKSQADRQI